MVLLNMISDLAELKAKTRDCKYVRKIRMSREESRYGDLISWSMWKHSTAANSKIL